MSTRLPLQRWTWAALALCSAAFALGCEESVPTCAEGEMLYRGRPPRQLFRQDCSCRADCFSLPQQGPGCLEQSAYAKCSQDCGLVGVDAPAGELRAELDYFQILDKESDERALVLVDSTSMDDGRALVFEFAYRDGLGGEAPTHWGFLAAGPRTYLSDSAFSSAVFRMRVGVARDVNGDGVFNLDEGICRQICTDTAQCAEHFECAEGLCVPGPEAAASGLATVGLRCVSISNCEANQACVGGGEVEAAGGAVVYADPGRLDMEIVSENRLRGRFYLGFKTPTGQAQGEVLGCFDLRVQDRPDASVPRRLLAP